MRNIHLPVESPAIEQACKISTLPRLRERTNDPLTEYRQRPGEVERLPDSVAALILCKTGRSVVERHQIKVTLEKRDYFFASKDSLIIAAKNGTGEKVLWALNRMTRDALHILSDAGEYIETIPLKGQAAWFDRSEESKRAYADAKGSIARDMERMQELHQEETRDAIADAQHNAAELHRLTATFPVADSDRTAHADTSQAGNTILPHRESPSFPQADRLKGAINQVEEVRADRAKTKARIRRVRGSLDDLMPEPETANERQPANDLSALI